MITTQDNLNWIVIDPAAGVSIAPLVGDPQQAGPYTARFRFPKGYEDGAHRHTVDEFITILKGRGRMAFGETARPADGEAWGPGSFLNLPAGNWHSFRVDEDLECEVHSFGPYEATTERA